MLFGSYIFGWISDRFGRWAAFYEQYIQNIPKRCKSKYHYFIFSFHQDEVFDVINSHCFSEWFPRVSLYCCVIKSSVQHIRAFCTGPLGLHLYALLRFITGVGAIGSFMVCFVLAVEHVGFKVTKAHSIQSQTFQLERLYKYNFQFTMLIGIAIEMPFALGEMLLGLEVILLEPNMHWDHL